MKTTVRTIMKARAQQRRSSLIVQGFKCHEIETRRIEKVDKQKYEDSKLELERLESLLEHTKSEIDTIKNLKKYISEYEDKHHWKKPEEIKEHDFMDKVRSLFSRRRR